MQRIIASILYTRPGFEFSVKSQCSLVSHKKNQIENLRIEISPA